MVDNMLAAETSVRPALMQYLNNRVDLVAKISDFRTTDGHSPFFALLRNVRFQNGKPAAEHAWTLWNKAMFKANVGVGDEIAMSARIIQYQRRDGSIDYGLDDLANVRLTFKLSDGRDAWVLSRASALLAARTAVGEVAVRNTDDPRMQAAMLSRFHADPGRHGHEIRVELGPAVALFMLTNSALALGLSLDEYADTLARTGSGKALMSENLRSLEGMNGAPPLILRLESLTDREIESQRDAEANLNAGKNLLDPDDDDEVVYYKMCWIRSAEELRTQLLQSGRSFIIYPIGVIGALAAWNRRRDSRAADNVAEILRLIGPVSPENRQKLARDLTREFGDWMRKQRRNLGRRTNYLKSLRAPGDIT